MFYSTLPVLFTITLFILFSFALNKDLHSQSWSNVPLLVDRNTVKLLSPEFSDGDTGEPDAACGIECQRNLPEPGSRELEHLLAYETVYENGTRTLTEVELRYVRNTTSSSSLIALPRKKRQVYGTDGRFVIADKRYITNFPFSTSVKLSTGCSGILVSPKHVLTSAHCIHDGHGYLKGLNRLRVGVMRLRRAGRRRNRKKEESKKKQKKIKGKKRKNQSKRKSFENPEQPMFRWIRVKQMYIPQGWISDMGNKMTLDYDYALLELKSRFQMKHMDLGVVPQVRRIHFSGFDDDHAGKMVYRFCSVIQESGDLMYQHCDAQRGSSGAGVYVRFQKAIGKAKGMWRRKVIGVFSGNRRMKEGNGTHRDYNVAVRITPFKLAQICLWIHGDTEPCASD